MNKKGFTLIELLIVVAIIGIVAAIAIPNLLVALQKGKQKASMEDLKSIGSAIESYLTDWAVAPGAGNYGALRVATYFVPFYMKIAPVVDGWGTEFVYAANLDLYSIESMGRNKQAGPVLANFEITRLSDFNYDLYLSNGIFTYAPARR